MFTEPRARVPTGMVGGPVGQREEARKQREITQRPRVGAPRFAWPCFCVALDVVISFDMFFF